MDHRVLQKKHNKYMKHTRNYIGFKNIHVDFLMVDMITDEIADELFVNFDWETIQTKDDIKWKEYFHALYDLVVFDHKAVGHASSLMLLRTIAINYEIIREPRYTPKSLQVEKIYVLFKKLKTEHLNILHFSIDNLFERLNESTRVLTQIQCDAHDIQQTIETIASSNEM